MKQSAILFVIAILAIGCQQIKTTPIGESTFVHGEKVYKLIDNELMEIADLNSTQIRRFEVLTPELRDLGVASLNYVKRGASGKISVLYRGNTLYFKLSIDGLNDLKEKYSAGEFTIEFQDEFGFILHSTSVKTFELTGLVDSNFKVTSYVFNGQTTMNSDISSEIGSFSITSTVRPRNSYGY